MKRLITLCAALLVAGAAWAQRPATIEWSALSHPDMRQTGYVQFQQTPLGVTFRFDGRSGAFFEQNPLAGMRELTMEVVFRPDGDGRFAQRFLHFGQVSGERIMFETRVKEGQWYFDAHTQLAGKDGAHLTLIDSTLLHPTDRWYSAAIVIGGGKITTYIDGVKELEGPLDYQPINSGVASVGVRQNLVDYFKGSIYKIRVTPRALKPEELLKDYQALNR